MPAPWDVEGLARGRGHRVVVPEEGGVRGILFDGVPYRGARSEVFAWLGVPPSGSPGAGVPGMVLLHAGAGRAYREWVERWTARGFAALAPDLGGLGPDGGRLSAGGPPQRPEASFDLSLPVTDLWPFHAVAAALAARAVLAAEPGVDPARIGILGISWGGCLALTAAGLEPRFGAAVSIYGTAFLQHPSGVERTAVFATMAEPDRRRWHGLFDPSHHLATLRAPALFVTGTTDGAFPLDVLAATCAALPVPPVLAVRRDMPHSHEAGWSAPEPYRFAGQVFRGEPPLPRLGVPTRQEGRLVAPLLEGAPVRATLLWTPDAGEWPGEWKGRRWRESSARVVRDRVAGDRGAGDGADGHRVEGELPPEARAALLCCDDGSAGLDSPVGSSTLWVEPPGSGRKRAGLAPS